MLLTVKLAARIFSVSQSVCAVHQDQEHSFAALLWGDRNKLWL